MGVGAPASSLCCFSVSDVKRDRRLGVRGRGETRWHEIVTCVSGRVEGWGRGNAIVSSVALLPLNPAARARTVLAEPDFGSSVGVYKYNKPGEGCGGRG